MTVARELVTRLSFVFDRTNLDKFEKAISNFKTKFDIGRLAIEKSFGRIIDFAGEFSDKILKQEALSKFTKVSIQDLDALQKAFKKFDVGPDVFSAIFEKLAIEIKAASRGVHNEFRKLSLETNGQVRIFIDGVATNVTTAIDDIRNRIQGLADESEQLRIIQNVFGFDLQTSNAILEFFKLTNEQFSEFVDKQKVSNEQLQKSKDTAREFKSQINQLSTEWERFQDKVAVTAVPLLNQSLGGINILTEKAQEEGFGSAFGLVLDSIGNAALELLGVETTQQLERRLLEEDLVFYRKLQEEYQNRSVNNSASVVNNNTFEFNVPPGTEESTAEYITQAMEAKLNTLWDQKTREVINNSPQVE